MSEKDLPKEMFACWEDDSDAHPGTFYDPAGFASEGEAKRVGRYVLTETLIVNRKTVTTVTKEKRAKKGK